MNSWNMKDKLKVLINLAYHWGKDKGSGRSEKNLDDFMFRDSVQHLLNSIDKDAKSEAPCLALENKQRNIIKKKILKCLTEDFKGNQAIFDKKEGFAVFNGTDLEMVMDKVVKGLEFAKAEINGKG